MTMKAHKVLTEAEQHRTRHRQHLRDVADWFHDHEGEMFEREEARDRIADDLDLDEDVAMDTIRNLIGDDVDPVVQASVRGTRYVGVAEFKEFDGAYGYLDYHDTMGQRKRVICAQCVHNADYDYEVTHATAGDPEGSYDPDASYSELLSGVHDHYEKAHDAVPEEVETGASLVSGTTIGGNTAWHAGNDGGGSGLDADSVDGNHSSDFATQTEVENATGATLPSTISDAQYGHWKGQNSEASTTNGYWHTVNSVTQDVTNRMGLHMHCEGKEANSTWSSSDTLKYRIVRDGSTVASKDINGTNTYTTIDQYQNVTNETGNTTIEFQAIADGNTVYLRDMFAEITLNETDVA